MDIYAKENYKVIGHFRDGRICGGYDSEEEYAMKYLKEGVIYTVDHTDVGGWHTDVYLKEFPGKSFNSVQFLGENSEEFKRIERRKKLESIMNRGNKMGLSLQE